MPKPFLPRQRNLVFDALAEMDSPDIKELTAPSRVAKAMQVIKGVCPDVTADEIRRRAANLRALWPNATIKSTTLAYNWGLAKGTVEPSSGAKRDSSRMRQELAEIEHELAALPPEANQISPYVEGLIARKNLLRRQLGHA